MSVTFDEQVVERPLDSSEPRGLSKLLIKYSGGRLDEKTSTLVLVVFIILLLALSAFILTSGSPKASEDRTIPEGMTVPN